ncbi:hypothetical protein CDV58_09452, partial [Aspergillus fumigatus]
EEYEDEDEDEDESSVGEEGFAFFDGVASEARTPEGDDACIRRTGGESLSTRAQQWSAGHK